MMLNTAARNRKESARETREDSDISAPVMTMRLKSTL